MSENKRGASQIEVHLEEEIAQGHYANMAIISHSHTEFIVDFAAILPGVAKAKVRSRIILTPEHAKRVMLSLQDNISRYESMNGAIEIKQSRSHVDNYDPNSKLGEA